MRFHMNFVFQTARERENPGHGECECQKTGLSGVTGVRFAATLWAGRPCDADFCRVHPAIPGGSSAFEISSVDRHSGFVILWSLEGSG